MTQPTYNLQNDNSDLSHIICNCDQCVAQVEWSGVEWSGLIGMTVLLRVAVLIDEKSVATVAIELRYNNSSTMNLSM